MTENGTLRDALYDLYLVDQQLRGLENRLSGAKRFLKAQTEKFNKLQEQHQTLHDQQMRLQALVDSLENDTNASEERINKLRDQMNTVTNNKEYSALLVEVNTLKAEKGKIEEQELQHMTELDKLKERTSELQTQMDDQAKLCEQAKTDLDKRTAEVQDQLDSVQSKRDDAAKALDPNTLHSFEELCLSYDGEALATVECEDRRRMEFICNSCYTMLPLEVVNKLITSQDIITCPSCRRLLHMPTAVREEVQGK